MHLVFTRCIIVTKGGIALELSLRIAPIVISTVAFVISMLSFRHSRNRGKAEKAHEMARFYEEKLLFALGEISDLVKGNPEVAKLRSSIDECVQPKGSFTDLFRQGISEALSLLCPDG